MKKLLAVLLAIILLAFSASADVDMWREHEFKIGESQIYDYHGDKYTFRVMGTNSGGAGEARLRINNFEKTVTGNVPIHFEDVKVSLLKTGSQNVTLRMEWSTEETEPDASTYISRNVKERVEAGGKDFVTIFTKYDTIRNRATVEVNGESFTLSVGDKVELEDGSNLKLENIVGSSIKRVKLGFWVSESEMYAKEEKESFDFSQRITEGQELSADVKGQVFDIRLSRVSDGNVSLTFNGEEYSFSDGEMLELDSGLVLRVSQVTMRKPKGARLEMQVPDTERIVEKEVVQRTLSENQKDSFETLDKTVSTHVTDINDSTVKAEINGEEITLARGEEKKLGNIVVAAKIINANVNPPKAILEYTVSKEIEEQTASEAGEKDDAERNETKGGDEGKSEEATADEGSSEGEKETKESETVPEESTSEDAKKETTDEPSQISKTISNSWDKVKETAGKAGNAAGRMFKPVTNFFKWAFG